MKVAELEGVELDAAVAKAEGHEFRIGMDGTIPTCWLKKEADGRPVAERYPPTSAFDPSTYWAHGGPIIERERITLTPLGDGDWDAVLVYKTGAVSYGAGPTPLIAAMRAYVASRFGDEVA